MQAPPSTDSVAVRTIQFCNNFLTDEFLTSARARGDIKGLQLTNIRFKWQSVPVQTANKAIGETQLFLFKHLNCKLSQHRLSS